MLSKYNPKDYEEKIYSIWLDSGVFSPQIDDKLKPFTIVMPPPNITGQLHMGHALNNSLQDVIVRYKRMQGFNALFLPGTDHASIATELKIVEQLKKEGLTKESIGRSQFLQRAYDWKNKYGSKIVQQLKKLGVSCDWDREAFTMDQHCSFAVKSAFVKMYNDGLIYQGDRIINWCVECKTAISDAEVEYESNDGHIWYINYPYSDGSGFITVATTRPETMLGDVAVAVNPNDNRYTKSVGKTLLLPLSDRIIPIVADNYVDAKFGSGAVKITPAHDPNDFLLGERHNLPTIRVIDDSGNINCQPCLGMNRYTAREYIIKALKDKGLLVKVEKHNNNVGHCYRCHTVVEPLISKQWFVKMQQLAKDAIAVVESGEISFLPKQYAKIYLHWMYNIKDWCISRGLWWGHRIPVYYCDNCGNTVVTVDNVENCNNCGHTVRQDESVLDTWFSSALWPFATLGYPDDTPQLKYFYPTDLLVTAYDIIFFWVARMIFSGLYHTGRSPFEKVLIHGIVRDEFGKKMSKSLGNGIDPLEIIEEYGADCLRYSLLSGIAEGSDIRYSKSKLDGSQNFLNKIFNASKFVLINLDNLQILPLEKCRLTIADKWILTKLATTLNTVCNNFDKFKIGQAISAMYNFVWDDFCDWYIEVCKTSLYSVEGDKRQCTASILVFVLDAILKMLHPIVPFITEQIYSYMPSAQGLIATKSFPNPKSIKSYKKPTADFEKIIQMIKCIRSLRKEINITPSKKIKLFIEAKDNSHTKLIDANIDIVKRLAGVEQIIFDNSQQNGAKVLTSCGMIKIPYDGNVDYSLEIERIKKELSTANAELTRAVGKLNNQGFVNKAPKALIEQESKKIQIYKEKVDKLQLELSQILQNK